MIVNDERAYGSCEIQQMQWSLWTVDLLRVWKFKKFQYFFRKTIVNFLECMLK